MSRVFRALPLTSCPRALGANRPQDVHEATLRAPSHTVPQRRPCGTPCLTLTTSRLLISDQNSSQKRPSVTRCWTLTPRPRTEEAGRQAGQLRAEGPVSARGGAPLPTADSVRQWPAQAGARGRLDGVDNTLSSRVREVLTGSSRRRKRGRHGHTPLPLLLTQSRLTHVPALGALGGTSRCLCLLCPPPGQSCELSVPRNGRLPPPAATQPQSF